MNSFYSQFFFHSLREIISKTMRYGVVHVYKSVRRMMWTKNTYNCVDRSAYVISILFPSHRIFFLLKNASFDFIWNKTEKTHFYFFFLIFLCVALRLVFSIFQWKFFVLFHRRLDSRQLDSSYILQCVFCFASISLLYLCFYLIRLAFCSAQFLLFDSFVSLCLS